MDKVVRGKLLRDRFKARGGKPFAPSGRPRKPARSSPGHMNFFGFPQANRDASRAGKWFQRPEPKPKVALAIKRRRGTSALTCIAKKWESRPRMPKRLLASQR